MLRRRTATDVRTSRRDPVDAETLAVAAEIVAAVREEGMTAVLRYAERYGDLSGAPVIDRSELDAARAGLPRHQREVLERTADRIRRFAEVQKSGLLDVETVVPGGRAGLRYTPVERAGCYAPGGRYPLPSSVLMTAVTARVAGVREVWVASPRPAQATLAAAAIADVDAVLAVGGAQAIAAMAFGAAPVPPADAIVGPGNRWVTAAKQLVSGRVRIDMLAGPSELVVVADASAHASWVAADLIAQAEHDPEALPVLIALGEEVANGVDRALMEQQRQRPEARAALEGGFAVVVGDLTEAIALSDRLAPEHLALHLDDADEASARFSHFGALFIGAGAAEVFGDYGAGPNHVLPTGGTARSVGALSVSTFVRAQTWLTMEDPRVLAQDAAALARIEGLEGHAVAAELRAATSLSHGGV
jgi:histidinol dehydrogenase